MFFRHGTSTGKRVSARSGGTSEAQLKELRSKARRRLIGALALVLAAFIVVPWLFEKPASEDSHAPVVVPAAPAGLPAAPEPSQTQADGAASAAPATNPAGGAVAQNGAQTPAPADPGTMGQSSTQQSGSPASPVVAQTAPATTGAVSQPGSATPAARPSARPEAPPAPAKPAADAGKPQKPAKPPVERTDDGSVALALLAGKSPSPARGAAPAAAPQTAGRYFLQVAAYTTEQDAQRRRDSLRQSGVTDAYVEQGQSGGRTVYRLRVGPFSSHEAAQAAQTRLRALGYQNGLISDK